MSTQLKPLPPLQRERCECPQCESTIAEVNVFNRFDFEQSPSTRTVAIFCVHCDCFWEKSYELRGGIWIPSSDTKVITAKKRLEGLRKKVNELGRIQLAQSA